MFVELRRGSIPLQRSGMLSSSKRLWDLLPATRGRVVFENSRPLAPNCLSHRISRQ